MLDSAERDIVALPLPLIIDALHQFPSWLISSDQSPSQRTITFELPPYAGISTSEGLTDNDEGPLMQAAQRTASTDSAMILFISDFFIYWKLVARSRATNLL